LFASVITAVTFSFTFRESALSECAVYCYVLLNYSRASIFADSVSAVYRGLKKNLKIKEIIGS
jgi:hypothetical protein